MDESVIEGFRLSPLQLRLWQQQLDEQAVYRTQVAALMEGELDQAAFDSALNQVFRRHEILRTSYQHLPGMDVPVQVIAPDCELSLVRHNLSDLSPDEHEAAIEALLKEARVQPFNYRSVPLINLMLLSFTPTKNVLLIDSSALSTDSLGAVNLVMEIGRAYEASLVEDELVGEVMQYADISEWQNEMIEGEEAEEGIRYWAEQGIRFEPCLELPFQNRASDGPVFDPDFLELTIDHNTAEKIKHLVKEVSIDESVFYLTCWYVLVWRLTGQRDVVIGMTCPGRDFRELHDALGLFEKYLPFQNSLRLDLPWQELLRQVNKTATEMFEWQEFFSWDNISGKSPIGVNKRFFPVCFTFAEQTEVFRAGNVSFSVCKQYVCTERFALKLLCRRNAEGMTAEFHYDRSLADREAIKRLSEQFRTLLHSAAGGPDAVVGEMEIVGETERTQLVVEFNQTQAEHRADTCIQEFIEQRAADCPDNVALVLEKGQLSYAELNTRANQLAHYLRKQGVGPDVLVGICLERSFEMVVGILGILKAGGAYVPLDPSYPKERLAFILTDTKAPVLVTQQKFGDQFPEHSAHILRLDADWRAITVENTANPAVETDTANVAYIIYTSGSTGQPKGVVVSHRNLVHSTSARLENYADPPLRFLILPSLAFDSSVAGIFWTLCRGGTLVLPPDGLERDINYIARMIAHHHVTHLLLLPLLYSHLLASATREQLSSLQTVIVAGEVCPRQLVDEHFKKLSTTTLYNEYGPTEGTVWSSVYRCRPKENYERVPIGRPISNTKMYVLDTNMQLVPIGALGELCIGGAGVAQGYLNQPSLTSKKFVPDPFSTGGEARIYKSGDMGRCLADGNFEFLGRIDNQVKISGYRIELEEIETILTSHPAIQESVVVARNDANGQHEHIQQVMSPGHGTPVISTNSYLVAYVVPCKTSPSSNELRGFLIEVLPVFMVPYTFVFLDVLPRTPNGKVDRQSLPEPRRREDFVAPRNPVEELIVGLWCELLGMENIGVHDVFFEVGGHSLMVTQFMSRLRYSLGVEIPLAAIFEAPTAAMLTEKILQNQNDRAQIEEIAEMLLEMTQLSEEQ